LRSQITGRAAVLPCCDPDFFHQVLALRDRVTLLGQHPDPADQKHTRCANGCLAHDEHPSPDQQDDPLPPMAP
jgi:hypothetical protein